MANQNEPIHNAKSYRNVFPLEILFQRKYEIVKKKNKIDKIILMDFENRKDWNALKHNNFYMYRIKGEAQNHNEKILLKILN
ncbi:MAG: hypothetical protein LC122_01660 [Chitinophagales bacterium]|nr:hypothetical protein [Chitinophagales bacterium]